MPVLRHFLFSGRTINSQAVQLSPTSPAAIVGTELTFTCTGMGYVAYFFWSRNTVTTGYIAPQCRAAELDTTLYSYACPDNKSVTLTKKNVTLGDGSRF